MNTQIYSTPSLLIHTLCTEFDSHRCVQGLWMHQEAQFIHILHLSSSTNSVPETMRLLKLGISSLLSMGNTVLKTSSK